MDISYSDKLSPVVLANVSSKDEWEVSNAFTFILVRLNIVNYPVKVKILWCSSELLYWCGKGHIPHSDLVADPARFFVTIFWDLCLIPCPFYVITAKYLFKIFFCFFHTQNCIKKFWSGTTIPEIFCQVNFCRGRRLKSQLWWRRRTLPTGSGRCSSAARTPWNSGWSSSSWRTWSSISAISRWIMDFFGFLWFLPLHGNRWPACISLFLGVT